MKFIIKGNPIAKMRHRHRGRLSYDPQEKDKEVVRFDLLSQTAQGSKSENKSILGPLKEAGEASGYKVRMEFHCQPTKKDPWSLNSKFNMQDVDNLCKFYLDCCNGILFSDDHKVVEISARKCYNPFPKTLIDITPMTNQIDLSSESKLALKSFSPLEMKDFLDDVWGFTIFHSADFEVMPQSEWESWMTNVSFRQAQFAKKWGEKLHKLATKIEKSNV